MLLDEEVAITKAAVGLELQLLTPRRPAPALPGMLGDAWESLKWPGQEWVARGSLGRPVGESGKTAQVRKT